MNRFENIIKKYKLDEILLLIGEINREIFNSHKAFIPIEWEKKMGDLSHKGTMYICPWDLNDIVYNAVCSSNDYRSVVPNKQDIVSIVSAFKELDDNISAQKLESISEEDMGIYIMFGHSQKQFWYQSRSEIIEDFNRNTELLEVIPKEIDSKIDIENIVTETTGFIPRDFNMLILLIFVLSVNNTDVSKVKIDESLTDKVSLFNIDAINKVIKLYTTDYSEIRSAELAENYLFVKPIIKTTRGKLIISNVFLLAKSFSEGLFWILRNHFFKKGSQDFTNEFGRYFERYVEKLFKRYLHEGQFEKLEEVKNHKIADWKIETNKYIIIIEQKSSIASIKLKNMYPNLLSLDKYLEIFTKAFEQLSETQQYLKLESCNKILIKIIVHYEKLYIPEIIKDRVLKIMEKSYESELNTFFASISELEILISILFKNESLFNEIMQQRMTLEEEHFNQGRSFSQIFDRNGVRENEYIKNYVNHYDAILERIKRSTKEE